MTVRERIARLYAAHPDGERAAGRRVGRRPTGQSWIAAQGARVLGAPIAPRTVREWVARDRLPPAGRLVIEALEREAGL